MSLPDKKERYGALTQVITFRKCLSMTLPCITSKQRNQPIFKFLLGRYSSLADYKPRSLEFLCFINIYIYISSSLLDLSNQHIVSTSKMFHVCISTPSNHSCVHRTYHELAVEASELEVVNYLLIDCNPSVYCSNHKGVHKDIVPVSPILVSNVIILSHLLVSYHPKCGKPIFEGRGHIDVTTDHLIPL
jgi:hypothetical protein